MYTSHNYKINWCSFQYIVNISTNYIFGSIQLV